MTGTDLAIDLAEHIAPAFFFALGLCAAWNQWRKLSS